MQRNTLTLAAGDKIVNPKIGVAPGYPRMPIFGHRIGESLPPMYESELLARTRRLWRSRDRAMTIAKVSQETGLKPKWLLLFGQEVSRSPAVDKVERLYVYLTGRPLDLDNL